MKTILLLICTSVLLFGCGGGSGGEGKTTDNTQVGSGGSGSGGSDGNGSGGSGGSGSGGSDGSGSGGSDGNGSDGSGGSGSGGSDGNGSDGSGGSGSGGSDGSGSGGSGGSGGGQVKPTLDEYEQLPLTFSADATRNGHTVQIKVSKYSVRRADTEFYYYDASKSSSLIAFDYTPEVRSYRGQIVGEPSSQIIGYVDSTNKFYGFVFYGEDKAWTIENLTVPKLNRTAQKTSDKALHRPQAELVPIDNSYQLPTPSLNSPIPAQAQMKLQMSSLGFLIDIDSFNTSFDKNMINAIAGMDHTTNALDYLFARDALVRVDYPIGVITVNTEGKTAAEMQPILKPLVFAKTKSPFSIFQTLFKKGERCYAVGLSISCDFDPKLAHSLHEIGHAFELGHHVGPETNTLMNFALAIDTNMISVVKSSRAIEPRLAPSMSSPISPKANIDHAGTARDQSLLIDVLANDFDANGSNKGGAITLSEFTTFSQRGAKIERQGNQLKYTPAEGFVGEDHFGYTITDDSGMKDSSEVHVSVKSKSRVLYLSSDQYKVRNDIKNHSEKDRPNFKQLINQAGSEQFFGKLSTVAYPDIGFHQFVLDQTSTNTAADFTEPTFEENNLMTLQRHMPHDLAPGKQSYTLVVRFKQDGNYTTVAENKGIHEVALFSAGKLDEGFGFSHFNGNGSRQHKGEPAKGLGWTLVSRQMFSRESFSQLPHTVHAFADPSSVNVEDNAWHSIAWVIDRENNRVSTWVDGVILPMALSTNPSSFVNYVPLPTGFEGVYPGGTHGWIDSSWDAAVETYGPWFMRTNGANKGEGGDEIWNSFTKFISEKVNVDDVQIYTYALAEQEIKNISDNKGRAFTNSPINGVAIPFSSPISLTWGSKHSTNYRVKWGYDTSLANTESDQTTKALSITPDNAQKSLYWRVDSKYGSEWIEGNVWSISNSELIGQALALTFTEHEVNEQPLGANNAPWPKNVTKILNGINVVVTNQSISNDASILRLSKNNAVTLTDNSGRPFSQMRFSASQWTAGVDGYLQAEYFDGTSWVSLMKLNKGGIASGYGYGGLPTTFSGIGSTETRGSKPHWYDPAALDASAYYTVNFPANTSQVRLKYYSTDVDRNQVAIDQLNVYR